MRRGNSRVVPAALLGIVALLVAYAPRVLAGTAALVLHHPDDHLVPIGSGERVRDAFRAANDLAAAPAAPTVHPAFAHLNCVSYADGDGLHPVVWYPHDDATAPGGRYDPHTWPDGAATAIAAFFTGLPGAARPSTDGWGPPPLRQRRRARSARQESP